MSVWQASDWHGKRYRTEYPDSNGHRTVPGLVSNDLASLLADATIQLLFSDLLLP